MEAISQLLHFGLKLYHICRNSCRRWELGPRLGNAASVSYANRFDMEDLPTCSQHSTTLVSSCPTNVQCSMRPT